MESRTLLLLLLHPAPPPPPPPPWRFPISLLSHSSSHSRLRLLPLRRSLSNIRARKFDFGPRNYDDDDDFGDDDVGGRRKSKRRRRRRPKQRQWWFDERERIRLDEREPSVLDKVIDSLWFLKVLRSYGWFLPAILLSLLIANGPKAFLMAFSLPLGLSLLTLVFKKVPAWLEGTPEPKQRRRTTSPFARAKPSPMEEEEDDKEGQPRGRSQKSRYRSWAGSNNGSVYKGNSSSKFGGWDELLIEEQEIGSASRPEPKTDEQETPVQEAMSNMPIRERELPLLLKLLVALFPFLGSWTSLL